MSEIVALQEIYPSAPTKEELVSKINFLKQTYPNGTIAQKLVRNYERMLNRL